MKKFFIILPLLFLIYACEKDISVDLPASSNRIVVDGYVETGLPPYLILSRSASYFSAINSSVINDNAETGAIVTVDDGFTKETMQEIDTTIFGYKVKGVYIAVNMTGSPGKTYTLNIKTSKGENITAVTNLKLPVPLDSIWFKQRDDNDSLGVVFANLHDPDTLGNAYRWFAKRIGKDPFYIAPFGSSFEDKFINGKKFDFGYQRGSIQNSSADDDNNEEANYFKRGDTIVVKFCTIDYSTFEFWRDAETQISNNGSPFAVPSNVKSNIVGGLGVWGSYSSSYDTLYTIR